MTQAIALLMMLLRFWNPLPDWPVPRQRVLIAMDGIPLGCPCVDLACAFAAWDGSSSLHIYFAPGVYRVSKPIRFPHDDIRLIGSGNGRTRLEFP